jgi:hypothetical protein
MKNGRFHPMESKVDQICVRISSPMGRMDRIPEGKFETWMSGSFRMGKESVGRNVELKNVINFIPVRSNPKISCSDPENPHVVHSYRPDPGMQPNR